MKSRVRCCKACAQDHLTYGQGATQYFLAMRRDCDLILIEATVYFSEEK